MEDRIMPSLEQRAALFDDADVARSYAHRPPYAPALYEFLLSLVPRRRCLIDLGCGPGKVAAALAGEFDQVIAVDPAIAMITIARETHRQPNIAWLHARAEDISLPDAIDLVTAGTAIHWMRHDVLFPALAARAPLIAIVTGDAPAEPPWAAEQAVFLTNWLARLHGQTYDPVAFAAEGRTYEPWLDIAGRRDFAFTFRQSVADHIACQHSRASWTRTRMGAALAAEFDRELEAVLTPFATDGMLSFELTSQLVWGTPRTTPSVAG